MTKVLIVDDNPQNLYMLETVLRSNGFQVITASNGAEGLEKARGDRPDLVISDILMPVMDGFQLCQKWKVDDLLKDIPFIFYTATYTDEKDERFALSLGADMFLIKPMKPDALIENVRNVLARPDRPTSMIRTEDDPQALREYNEIIFHKLEKKVMELEIDISEREAAERALRESEERFRKVFESGAVGIAIVDPDERILHINGQFCEMLGHSEDELQGTRMMDSAHPDHRMNGSESLAMLKAGKMPAYTTQMRFVRKDGSNVWALFKASTINDEDGRIQYLIVFANDITEHVVMREREKQALAQIERNLEQLAALNDQIRNPLSVIVGLLTGEEKTVTNQKIIQAVRSIDDIVKALDKGWIESAKVREFLQRYDQINRGE